MCALHGVDPFTTRAIAATRPLAWRHRHDAEVVCSASKGSPNIVTPGWRPSWLGVSSAWAWVDAAAFPAYRRGIELAVRPGQVKRQDLWVDAPRRCRPSDEAERMSRGLRLNPRS